MASIIRDIIINAPARIAWDAVSDVGNVHKKLAPGFVTDSVLEGDERIVRFLNGVVIREVIVDVNAAHMRLSYASIAGKARHHNASIQITETGDESKCRLIWITDVLPDEFAGYITANVEAALPIMKLTIEAAAKNKGAE